MENRVTKVMSMIRNVSSVDLFLLFCSCLKDFFSMLMMTNVSTVVSELRQNLTLWSDFVLTPFPLFIICFENITTCYTMRNVSGVVSGLRQNLTLRSETDWGMGGELSGG